MRSCKSVRSVELEDAISLTPSSRRGRASKVLMPSRPGDVGGEVLDDCVQVVVVIERLARRELEAAAPPRRNRIAIPGFPGFDYPRM